MSILSKRLGIAVVAAVVLIAVLTSPVTMICTTMLGCTYIIAETLRKS